jgi:hypothetical protein
MLRLNLSSVLPVVYGAVARYQYAAEEYQAFEKLVHAEPEGRRVRRRLKALERWMEWNNCERCGRRWIDHDDTGIVRGCV